MYEKDRRIVITLDAGGTNFVFGAVQGDRFVVEPITLPSNSDRLDRCLETMVEGFRTVISRLPEQPAAISFAFPGPADYPRGIIGGYLPNFPSFRDGVALKDFLEERFGIPTFTPTAKRWRVHCPKSTPGSKPQEAPNASAT